MASIAGTKGSAVEPILPSGLEDAERPSPPADPSIAGWKLWSTEVVVSVLRLTAEAADVPDCALVWMGEDGELVSISSSGVLPAANRLRLWWDDAILAEHEGAFQARDGAIVVPVGHALGGLGAAVVLPDGAAGGQRARRAAEAHTDFLRTLLNNSGVHQSRAGAYEALFQIGTQIQAQEVNAEEVFQLIIEHARDLLKTDVAWLGLVDEERGRVWMKVATGVTTKEFSRMEVAVGTGIGGVAVREGRPVSVSDHALYDSGMPSSVHRALKGEGVVSILCAPLLQEGGTLGALYVGTRTPAKFSEASASLLSALAAQAAIAIKNARLYQTLSDKNETLERTFTIHRLLTDASLSGAGMHKIALELARLIERDVVLSLDDPGGSRHRYSSHQLGGTGVELTAGEDEEPGFAVDIMAGRVAFGTLIAVGDRELDALQRNAVEYGATVIALELVKAQSALDVEWRLQGELLEELLETSAPSEGLLLRAERQGVEVCRPRRVVVLQPGRGTAAASLLEIVRTSLRHSEHWREGLVAQRGDRVIVAVPDEGRGEETSAFLSRLRTAATASTTSFAAGVSATRTDLRTALKEAESAAALAVSSGAADALLGYEDLGPLRFMLDAPDTAQMVGMVREILGPLAAHDAVKHSDLLATLRAYLETGCHHPKTAERCYIHVSTLKYRLSRISTILDRKLNTPESRFELGLAFAVLQVLEILKVQAFEQ